MKNTYKKIIGDTGIRYDVLDLPGSNWFAMESISEVGSDLSRNVALKMSMDAYEVLPLLCNIQLDSGVNLTNREKKLVSTPLIDIRRNRYYNKEVNRTMLGSVTTLTDDILSIMAKNTYFILNNDALSDLDNVKSILSCIIDSHTNSDEYMRFRSSIDMPYVEDDVKISIEKITPDLVKEFYKDYINNVYIRYVIIYDSTKENIYDIINAYEAICSNDMSMYGVFTKIASNPIPIVLDKDITKMTHNRIMISIDLDKLGVSENTIRSIMSILNYKYHPYVELSKIRKGSSLSYELTMSETVTELVHLDSENFEIIILNGLAAYIQSEIDELEKNDCTVELSKRLTLELSACISRTKIKANTVGYIDAFNYITSDLSVADQMLDRIKQHDSDYDIAIDILHEASLEDLVDGLSKIKNAIKNKTIISYIPKKRI